MLAELAVMLELFGPCEVDPPGVPLVNLSGDPLAFVLLAFPALLSLPMLAPPLLGVLLLAMLGLGQRRARRTRAGQGRSVRASQHLAERSIEPGESRGEL